MTVQPSHGDSGAAPRDGLPSPPPNEAIYNKQAPTHTQVMSGQVTNSPLSRSQVSATDPDCGVNAQVNYSIGHGFKKLESFSIQANTGEICISAPLDHEQRAIYEFPVVAMDRGEFSRSPWLPWSFVSQR